MPHADEGPTPVDIDEDGNMTYQTSPTDTVASEVMGMPIKVGSPWTGQAHASPSAVKPAQTRQRHRSQMPKQSLVDTSLNEGPLDDSQGRAMQLLRNTAQLLPEPCDDVENLGESSPIKDRAQKGGKLDGSCPVPPRSGQNTFLSMTDDGEDQGLMSDAARSPTPKPSRSTSSRKRRMSDASDMPALPQPERVASSRQKEMSDPPTIEERPKKKGIPQFSSTAPSVTDSIDNEPLPIIPEMIQNSSSISSQTAEQAKMVPHRRKSVSKLNTKLRLSALDLEHDKEMDEQTDDPFDQANIPSSRGISPGTSWKKPKQAPRKHPTAKPSKLSLPTKKTSPRAMVSPQERQSVRPRQKAKPSAADVVQESVAPGCGENNGNNEYLSDEPLSPTSNGSPAKSATVRAPALTRTAKTIKNQASCHQKEVIFISSATESEDFDTDVSDGDEYVESGSKVFEVNRKPLRNTRNTTTRSRGSNEVGTVSTKSTASGRGKGKRKATEKQGEQDDDIDLMSKITSKKSNKNVAQASVTKPDPSIEVKSKDKSTDTAPSSPLPNKTITTQKRGSLSKKQNNPDKTRETSFAIESATRQVKHLKTMPPSMITSRDADEDQKEPISTVASLSESYPRQSRITRQSRGDPSQDDPISPSLKAKQSKNRAERTEMDLSAQEAQDERKSRIHGSKNKDRKANIIVFGVEGPKNTGKSKEKASVADHRSEQQDSGNSTGPSTSKAEKKGKSLTGSNNPAQNAKKSNLQSAKSSDNSLAHHAQMQQPSPQVNSQPNAVHSTVDLSSSSVRQRGRGTRALQKSTTTIARKPSVILEETENCTTSPPVRVNIGKYPAPTHVNNEGDVPNGDEYAGTDDANDIADIQLEDEPVDEVQELLIPDGVQPDEILEGSVPVSQMRDSAMISNLLVQDPSGVSEVRKRPLPGECEPRIVLPVQDQSNSQPSADSHAPEFLHRPEQKIIVDHQPHQVTLVQKATVESDSASEQAVFDGHTTTHQYPAMDQQSGVEQQPSLIAKIQSVNQYSTTNQQHSLSHQAATSQRVAMEQLPIMMYQPTWKQHFTVNQQPMGVNKPFDNEQVGIKHNRRDSQAPFRQETISHQLPTLKNFSQPGTGKESAKIYLQDLSKTLHRPSKRVKLDVPEPDIASPASAPYSQFCVPAKGFSSDDVFAPKEVTENTDIDHNVVNQLRGITSAKYSAAPEMETQRSVGDHIENTYEPPRLRTSARDLIDATHSRSIQNQSQGPCRDGIPADTAGSDLWRRGMLNRPQGVLPGVKQKEQVGVQDSQPYEGVEDVMHQIVTGVLRALHSKESQVHQVVHDYRAGGGKIVESIAATHTNERKQLIEEHNNRRLDYVRICEDARRQIDSIGTDLQAIDFGKITMRTTDTKTLHRLRHA
ncbi:hypothetical protein N0V82_010448 [Gnomoniopsis sp. IMI 355080]|nr:hypothetical protein N0V82_010448 [Gnomoniopsis sp. IMI 355080]